MQMNATSRRLALLTAFLVCITLGFTLAVVLRERLGSTAQEDPCFGQGEVVDSWQRELTQADIDRAVSASRPDLADLEPGTIEYRRCRSGPGFEVIIDDMGHVYSYFQPTIEELEAYYKEHPEENPQNQIATARAESNAAMSVTPALPDAETMDAVVLAGCDPSWHSQDFPAVGLRLCYPADWRVFGEEPELSIGNDVTTMYFSSKASHEMETRCPDPARITTPAGEATLCEARPNLVEEGQSHSILLPIGHEIRYFITKPTLDSKWLALRVALAAEGLP